MHIWVGVNGQDTNAFVCLFLLVVKVLNCFCFLLNMHNLLTELKCIHVCVAV